MYSVLTPGMCYALREVFLVLFDGHRSTSNIRELCVPMENVVFVVDVVLENHAKLLVHRVVLVVVDGGRGVVVLSEET